MITPEYCQTMSQYNEWQNKALCDHVKAMPDADLRADRGVFFKSIFATLNHILWGDTLWLHRLGAAIDVPDASVPHTEATASPAEWSLERVKLDRLICSWARGLTSADLAGDVIWYSRFYKKEFHHLKSLCVTHMFNHQTHHRGQIHAMLTAAGQKTTDTDLVFMTEA